MQNTSKLFFPIVLLSLHSIEGQNIRTSGTIKDQAGAFLSGARVMLKNANRIDTTGADGAFLFQSPVNDVKPGSSMLSRSGLTAQIQDGFLTVNAFAGLRVSLRVFTQLGQELFSGNYTAATKPRLVEIRGVGADLVLVRIQSGDNTLDLQGYSKNGSLQASISVMSAAALPLQKASAGVSDSLVVTKEGFLRKAVFIANTDTSGIEIRMTSAAGCTREFLKSTVQAYFQALAAHATAGLPLAESVKFTENGKASGLGETALWKTAGMVKYSHSALDTVTCQTATHAVVPEGAMDIPFALRLKVQNQKVIEVETIAVRPGDYRVGGQNFPSNTAAIIASAATVRWEEIVPVGDRNSRKEITDWMNKYFRMFPRGVCNVTSTCKRLENGGGSFDCSAGASCAAGQPGPGDAELTPRLILADTETGIGVGLTMFQGNTDMHIFKMRNGQVHAVHTILGAAASPGWD